MSSSFTAGTLQTTSSDFSSASGELAIWKGGEVEQQCRSAVEGPPPKEVEQVPHQWHHGEATLASTDHGGYERRHVEISRLQLDSMPSSRSTSHHEPEPGPLATMACRRGWKCNELLDREGDNSDKLMPAQAFGFASPLRSPPRRVTRGKHHHDMVTAQSNHEKENSPTPSSDRAG